MGRAAKTKAKQSALGKKPSEFMIQLMLFCKVAYVCMYIHIKNGWGLPW